MNEHGSISSSRAGWALLGLSAAFVAAAAFLVRDAPTDVPGLEVATAEDVVDAVLHLAYPLVGALIIARNRANLFGWVFCLGALCFEANLFAGAYSTYGTFTHPGSLPAPQLLSLVSDLLLVPSFVLVVTMVPLLFPTGRPPTRRWWIVGVAAAVTIVLATISMAIRPGPVDEDVPSAGANPLGIAGAGGVADALEFAALARVPPRSRRISRLGGRPHPPLARRGAPAAEDLPRRRRRRVRGVLRPRRATRPRRGGRRRSPSLSSGSSRCRSRSPSHSSGPQRLPSGSNTRGP